MKRRDFLAGSAGLVGVALPLLARGQNVPCPPAELSVDGEPAVATSCKPTSLIELAKSLSRGQSSTSLGDTGLSSDARYTIQWANRFHLDLAHGRAHMLGKNAQSQNGQRSNCVYDLASNRWTYALWGGSELGHVYESIAYDPQRGELYTGQWAGGRALKRWTHGSSLTSWTDPATASFSSSINSDTQPTLCWHPNLFGSGDGGILALKNNGSDGGSIIAWRRANNQWYTVPGSTVSGMSGGYLSNGAIEYIAGGNFCIASFAPGKGGNTFRIDAGSNGNLASAKQISDVPIHCGYTDFANNVGVLIDDPAGGESAYILEKNGSARVWKYSAGSWVLKSYKHPFPSDTSKWVVASCRTLGVFWSQHQKDTASRLWRPND